MSKNLYKYAGPNIVENMFSEPGKCSFKCSFPKDFNDPYELFLTVDYNQEPAILAYYQEVIGTIPQKPTTCFSKSPSVIPMWAHYGQNHQGFAIEIDEDKLAKAFPEINFGDIDYRDNADESLTGLLHHAHMTCKPRHIYFLQVGVASAAYYTKGTCWSYELERRLVARPKDVVTLNGLMLIQVPVSCISALIVGAKATPEARQRIAEVSRQVGCALFEMQIGKNTTTPYFFGADKASYEFVEGAIVKCGNSCIKCNEPITNGRESCAWCSIDHTHEVGAAEGNPMRILAHFGMLDEYYEGVEQIRRGSHEL